MRCSIARSLSLCLVISSLSLEALANEPLPEARRHVEQAAGFSFIPPDGWNTREFPGQKYKIAIGTPHGGFAPNICVVDEKFAGTLEEYVNGNKTTIEQAFKKVKVVERAEVKTTAGVDGVRMIVENEQNGALLRQSFYFFDRGEQKYVVTCSTLADDGEKLDAVFAKSLQTFKWEGP